MTSDEQRQVAIDAVRFPTMRRNWTLSEYAIYSREMTNRPRFVDFKSPWFERWFKDHCSLEKTAKVAGLYADYFIRAK